MTVTDENGSTETVTVGITGPWLARPKGYRAYRGHWRNWRNRSDWGPGPQGPTGATGAAGTMSSRWYISGTGGVTDYTDVSNPAEGDCFLYPNSRDIFRRTSGAWVYPGRSGLLPPRST